MTLAQETDLLLLDEPTTFLDIAHQIDVLDLVEQLNREQRRTVVLVLHDLNLACRYADHIVAMRDGEIVAEGAPVDVITADIVRDVFGLDCVVIDDPVSHTPLVVPIGNRHATTSDEAFEIGAQGNHRGARNQPCSVRRNPSHVTHSLDHRSHPRHRRHRLLLQGPIIFGILLIIAGCLVGPGGYSIFNSRRA